MESIRIYGHRRADLHYRKRSRNPFWDKERGGLEWTREEEQGSLDTSVSSSLRVKIWVRDRDTQMALGTEKQGALSSSFKLWKEIDFPSVSDMRYESARKKWKCFLDKAKQSVDLERLPPTLPTQSQVPWISLRHTRNPRTILCVS